MKVRKVGRQWANPFFGTTFEKYARFKREQNLFRYRGD
jgi:hypothetical protein